MQPRNPCLNLNFNFYNEISIGVIFRFTFCPRSGRLGHRFTCQSVESTLAQTVKKKEGRAIIFASIKSPKSTSIIFEETMGDSQIKSRYSTIIGWWPSFWSQAWGRFRTNSDLRINWRSPPTKLTKKRWENGTLIDNRCLVKIDGSWKDEEEARDKRGRLENNGQILIGP